VISVNPLAVDFGTVHVTALSPSVGSDFTGAPMIFKVEVSNRTQAPLLLSARPTSPQLDVSSGGEQVTLFFFACLCCLNEGDDIGMENLSNIEFFFVGGASDTLSKIKTGCGSSFGGCRKPFRAETGFKAISQGRGLVWHLFSIQRGKNKLEKLKNVSKKLTLCVRAELDSYG